MTENIEEIPEIPIEDIQEKKKTFTIKKENSKIMKSIVETLSSIIDETKFTITKSEFIIEAMDPSRICLLRLVIKKGDFDKFETSGKFSICINLDDLDKILKRCGNTDALTMSYDDDTRKLKIQMKKDDSTRTRTFSLATLDIAIEDIPLENLMNIDYMTRFKIYPDFLIEAIKDAEIYSEILNIKSEEHFGLIFSSVGQIGEMEYQLEKDDLIEENLIDTESYAYSLTFLKSILKISNITETLELSLKADHPLKMEFSLLEGGTLLYWLAPRVENDLDDDDDLMEEIDDEL